MKQFVLHVQDIDIYSSGNLAFMICIIYDLCSTQTICDYIKNKNLY